jgi:hypothetical protein
MGNVVIPQFICPLVGYRFRSLRHVSAHVPLPGIYIRGEWGKSLFTSSLLPLPPPLLQSLRTSDLLHSPCAQIVDAREVCGAEEQDDQGEDCKHRDQLGALGVLAEGSGESPSQRPHLRRRSGHFP